MSTRVLNELVKSYWKPIITVKDQQVQQNGFPSISTTIGTYLGTGDTTIDVPNVTITIDVKLDNQLNTPPSFSNDDKIRFKLQNGNSVYNKFELKFPDISDLEVALKRGDTSIETFPDDSILKNKNYLATYTTGSPNYFLITASEGYFDDVLEENYVYLQKDIQAIINYAELFTGRTILDSDYTYSLSRLTDDFGTLCDIILPKSNVYELEKITYINTSDVETEMDLDTFCIEETGFYAEKFSIFPDTNLGFEIPDDVSETETYPYKVYYSAGYPNNIVPEALKAGIRDHCAFLWSNRGDMVNYAEIKEYKTLDKCDIAKDIYGKYKYKGI